MVVAVGPLELAVLCDADGFEGGDGVGGEGELEWVGGGESRGFLRVPEAELREGAGECVGGAVVGGAEGEGDGGVAEDGDGVFAREDADGARGECEGLGEGLCGVEVGPCAVWEGEVEGGVGL